MKKFSILCGHFNFVWSSVKPLLKYSCIFMYKYGALVVQDLPCVKIPRDGKGLGSKVPILNMSGIHPHLGSLKENTLVCQILVKS